MGSKAEVATLAMQCVTWVFHLLPYIGVGVAVSLCIGLLIDRLRNGYWNEELGGLTLGFIAIAVMIVGVYWWIALPDHPIPR